MATKALITGYKGFIGQHLFRALQKDHKVLGLDLKDRNDLFGDMLEPVIKKSDVVYHLAALTSVEQSFKNPGNVFRTNVLGTARVVELCMKYKKKLVYPSSAAVYYPELSPYAYSKKLAEDIVKGAIGSIPVSILRLYNVFGEGMNPDSGSVMYNFLTSKKLVVYGDGEQTRDFVHVRDVVDILSKAANPSWDGYIVDVGTGQAYSTNYVAGLFAHFRGKKLSYQPPRREIKWSVANTQMLRKLYKKPLSTELETDIKELVENSRT